MMRTKSLCRVSVLSMAMFLALACVWQSMAGAAANRNRASQAQSPHSLEMLGTKDANPPAQKTIDQDLDTIFAKTKAYFDKMAASPF